jgi:hypothetical protein
MILFKFATRSRPDKFKATIKNIAKHATQPYHVRITADADDNTMFNYAMMQWIGARPELSIRYGTKVNKIEAVNRDMDITPDWDIVVAMSDDMEFTVKGFDEQIIAAFDGNYDQLVHFPDGYVNEKLVTLPIMGRLYYERFHYIYHPTYKSLFCDNEQHDVAISLGKYKYVNSHIYKHQHAAWIGGPIDELLKETQAFYTEDEINYLRRKRFGFPKENVYL